MTGSIPDYGTTDPEAKVVLRLLISDLAFPEWGVVYATPEAKQRFVDWLEKERVAREGRV